MNIYKQRLLNVATFLDTVPDNRFNYRGWVGPDWKGMQDLSCGTTACALGWAATMPEFQALGVRLLRTASNYGFVGFENDNPNDYFWNVTKKIFDLSLEESRFLFLPNVNFVGMENSKYHGEDATAKMVADHIRAFVDYKYKD